MSQVQQYPKIEPATLLQCMNRHLQTFNLDEAEFQIDPLQEDLLNFYRRTDPRFRLAWATNYTGKFMLYLKEKAKLREPAILCCMGQVRGGKSYSSMTLCILHSAMNGFVFNHQYICANSFEFMEKLKVLPVEQLKNSMFQIDEQKDAVFGHGSLARKTKLVDIQNIIAINNISVIYLTPLKWSFEGASYGLRVMGRDFRSKTCRLMLYNLQESGRGGSVPVGMIYLPIFTSIFPKEYTDVLEQEYLGKKQQWVHGEMRGEADILALLKRKTAETLVNDPEYMALTKKNEKKLWVSMKMGSEWVTKEIEELVILTDMLRRGMNFSKDD